MALVHSMIFYFHRICNRHPQKVNGKFLICYAEGERVWVISKFNGTSTPKGSYRAKTGDNDYNVNSSRYSLRAALCESIRYQAKSKQNIRQDPIPRVRQGEAALCTPRRRKKQYVLFMGSMVCWKHQKMEIVVNNWMLWPAWVSHKSVRISCKPLFLLTYWYDTCIGLKLLLPW